MPSKDSSVANTCLLKANFWWEKILWWSETWTWADQNRWIGPIWIFQPVQEFSDGFSVYFSFFLPSWLRLLQLLCAHCTSQVHLHAQTSTRPLYWHKLRQREVRLFIVIVQLILHRFTQTLISSQHVKAFQIRFCMQTSCRWVLLWYLQFRTCCW